MSREPAIIIGLIDALVIAIIALVAYLLDWEAELVALVVGVAAALVAVIGAIVTRGRVTPVESNYDDG